MRHSPAASRRSKCGYFRRNRKGGSPTKGGREGGEGRGGEGRGGEGRGGEGRGGEGRGGRGGRVACFCVLSFYFVCYLFLSKGTKRNQPISLGPMTKQEGENPDAKKLPRETTGCGKIPADAQKKGKPGRGKVSLGGPFWLVAFFDRNQKKPTGPTFNQPKKREEEKKKNNGKKNKKMKT